MVKFVKSHLKMRKNFLGLHSSICLFVKMLHGNFAIESTSCYDICAYVIFFF